MEESRVTEFRPTQDNVLVRLEETKEKVTASGIILPKTRKSKLTEGVWAEVLAVGPGYRLRDGRGPMVTPDFGVGDYVYVDRLAGQDYSLDNSAPRQNQKTELGRLRIVRYDECIMVREHGAPDTQRSGCGCYVPCTE